MFPNLEAEQARNRMTNMQVAEKLDLSRASYENKKRTGKFYVSEIRMLCELFDCTYEYLFAAEKAS